MDMLYKRYACPLPILDEMIQVDRLEEFISEFINIRNEELKDQTVWELYLHSTMLTETFEEFRDRCIIEEGPDDEELSQKLEATVAQSMEILGDFKPEE